MPPQYKERGGQSPEPDMVQGWWVKKIQEGSV